MIFASLMIPLCCAQTSTPNEQLLEEIKSASDIFSGGEPFQLDADFTVQLTTPQVGHLTWKWAAKDLWVQEFTMGGYREMDLRKGESLYIRRNISFTPLHLWELKGLLAVDSISPNHWQVKKLKSPEGPGECMELRSLSRSGHGWKRQICIDPATKDLLSDELKSDSELRRKEFSEYQAFGTHRFPHSVKLVVDGSAVVKATVNGLQTKSFEPDVFSPPSDAIVRRECENKIPAVALKTPNPTYPSSQLRNGITGTSVVSLTILPDGSVDNVHLIGSSTHEMDAVTQQIVKTWKFKPAMCGNEAVTSDAQITVNFQRY